MGKMRNLQSIVLLSTIVIASSFLLFQLNAISASIKEAHRVLDFGCENEVDTDCLQPSKEMDSRSSGTEREVSSRSVEVDKKDPQQLWYSLHETVSAMQRWEPSGKPLSGKRICFVTSGIYGPIKVGGVAVMTYRQAKLYQENGADISVVYTGYLSADSTALWVKSFAAEGIRFMQAPFGSSSSRIGTSRMKRSHDLYEFLSQMEENGDHYDLIVFHDLYGIAYYVLEAKHLGIRFQRTVMMVHAHGSTKLSNFYNAKLEGDHLDGLVTYSMERQTVENADFVISPSEFYYRWMRDNGYSLGNNKYFTVYLMMPPDPFFDNRSSFGKKVHSTRFAFFGRMDRLKGTLTFLDALDLMVQGGYRLPDEVLFVGDAVTLNVQEGPQNSYEQIRYRSEQWPFNVTIIEHASSKTALETIKSGNFVMVNPTHGETASAVTIEALAVGVPIIASNVCAIPELFFDKEEFRKTSFAAGSAGQIADSLVAAMENGVTVNRRPLDSNQSRDLYVRVAMAAMDRILGTATVMADNRNTTVTVAILAARTDEYLLRTLKSVIRMVQYDRDIVVEIFVAAESIAVHRKVENIVSAWNSSPTNRRVPITSVSQTRDISPATARRHVLQHAKGDFILFVDDGTIPSETSLSTLLSAVHHSGADIASGFIESVESPTGISTDAQKRLLKLCMGGNRESLLFRDNICSSILLLRKDAAIQTGSFDENGYVSSEYIEWNTHFKFALHEKRSIVVPVVVASVDQPRSRREDGPEEVFFGHHSRVNTLCNSVGIPAAVCTSLLFSTERLSEKMD